MGKMQCKDIPDKPILEFLDHLHGAWATWFPGYGNSVVMAMPANIPKKLILSKMRSLIHRGVVDGCGCGCRGDFVITAKGKQVLHG